MKLSRSNNKALICKFHSRVVNISTTTEQVSDMFASLENPFIFGGNRSRQQAEGFSYWAACPREVLEATAKNADPMGMLDAALGKYKIADTGVETFVGGWAGYFSYELGRYIERLPETTVDDLKMPLIRFCFYDRFVTFDHSKNQWSVSALEIEGDEESVSGKLDVMEKVLRRSQSITVSVAQRANSDIMPECYISSQEYLAAVEKVKKYIADGDVYQVNYSRRFRSPYYGRPIDLFHWQNKWNPCGYSAFIGASDMSIVSASPELFVNVTSDIVRTKPIKGTRRHLDEVDADAVSINMRNKAELFDCEKEKAELNMIIDLERNDLGRICEYGTIKVTQPRTIEEHPTVFHAVATVQGHLRDGVTFCDLLRGMYPGGSITGAPKIRSMEIIDELEPRQRGVYTGSIGYIGVDGNVCLNIAIRTIVIKGHTAYAQTGGGIVADSIAEAEMEETVTKARALVEGVNAVNNLRKDEKWQKKFFSTAS